MSDKLPDGVVLEIAAPLPYGLPCTGCYFIKDGRNCPAEWSKETGGFVRSCTNNRDIIFREIGEK